MPNSVLFADDTEQRQNYMTEKFFELVKDYSRTNGITKATILSQIRNITTFKEVLRAVFSLDSSLAFFADNLKTHDFHAFFDRSEIQKIVEANQEDNLNIKDIKFPRRVVQVNKKSRVFFSGKIKGKRTIGYKSTFKIKGKEVTRLRDRLGRFISN